MEERIGSQIMQAQTDLEPLVLILIVMEERIGFGSIAPQIPE